MEKFWKVFLVVVLVLAVLGGATAIVIKNMDEDKLAVIESNVRFIENGDELNGYVFHVDALKKMKEDDLDDLIEGVDPVVTKNGTKTISYYPIVTLQCDICSSSIEGNEEDPRQDLFGLGISPCSVYSIMVYKLEDSDSSLTDNDIKNLYSLMIVYGDTLFSIKNGELMHIGDNGEIGVIIENDNIDDSVVHFNSSFFAEECQHNTKKELILKVHTINNAKVLKKFVGGIFA